MAGMRPCFLALPFLLGGSEWATITASNQNP
jgi:hypothetical protein